MQRSPNLNSAIYRCSISPIYPYAAEKYMVETTRCRKSALCRLFAVKQSFPVRSTLAEPPAQYRHHIFIIYSQLEYLFSNYALITYFSKGKLGKENVKIYFK